MPGSSRSLRHAARGLVVFLIPATTGELRGQDIELLGEIHGTRPPPAYYRQLRDDPNAFRFTLEGEERLDRLRAGMRARARFGPGARSVPAARQGLGPREEAVVGAFHFPLVLGLFSDGPGAPAFSRAAIQAEFFDGPNSLGQTIPEFFGELSGGLVEMVGETSDWQTTELTREEVTLGGGGLVASRTGGIGAFIEAVLKRVDAPGVDWSRFDQSGDGFVDLLTVIHPGRGAECDGATNRIWSHRWSLSSVTGGRLPDGFRTSTPRLDGQGYIHVDDYTVQPLLACDGEWISEIGTFAHELGHGFGLPDLYRTATGAFVPGAGNWDLMSTGGWGCGGTTPEHPCHMGAWTKAALGWVAVEIVEPGTDGVVALEAVERASGRVLKLPARDGSNEYLLLENRQRIGADRTLPEPGLLIWHVDEDILDRSWRSNGVNNNPDRQGVWLRQADGRDELTARNQGRGDAGDPFPGCIKPSQADYVDPSVPCGTNPAFHAGKPPAALTHQGGPFGATLTEIELVGAAPHDVRFRLNTGLSTITVEAEQGGVPVELAGFELDGELQGNTPIVFHSAPYQRHEITAASGVPLGPGERASFEAWRDGAPRSRVLETGLSDETLVASYGQEELRLEITTNDPARGIAPGSFSAEPGARLPEEDGFWFPRGTEFSILATPRRGFAFRDWIGAGGASLANPLALLLDEPEELMANFDLVYAVAPLPERFEIRAATPEEIVLDVRDGNAPVRWHVEEGRLPKGLMLDSPAGVIRGSAAETGDFRATLLAVDAIGLEARAALQMRVTAPVLFVDGLVSPFVGPNDRVTGAEKVFLDAVGNADGGYDVGDLRSYLLANPDLPQGAAAASSPPRRGASSQEGAPGALHPLRGGHARE